MEQAVESSRSKLSALEVAALAAVLVGYPLLQFFGPVPWGEWIEGIDRGERADWWLFWLAVFGLHFPSFLLVCWAVSKCGGWASIGLDWSFFRRRGLILAVVVVALAILAALTPGWYYGETLPSQAESMFMVPVSAAERLGVMVMVIIAGGVTEEVMFRGFAITRLASLTRSKWLGMLISAIAFAPIHYTTSPLEWAIYIAAGLFFGVLFLLLKMRRLEWLIVLHALIDLGIAFAP